MMMFETCSSNLSTTIDSVLIFWLSGVTAASMAGDNLLVKKVNAFLAKTFVSSRDLPADECLFEARALTYYTWPLIMFLNSDFFDAFFVSI
jgi:hypothetical protein